MSENNPLAKIITSLFRYSSRQENQELCPQTPVPTPARIPNTTTVPYIFAALCHDKVFPRINAEYTLNTPSVHSKVTTYGSGTPRVINTNATATSNAIGTGKNVPTSATATIPRIVTCTAKLVAGNNSAAVAPKRAATIINGTVTKIIFPRFLRNSATAELAVPSPDATSHTTSTTGFGA